MLVNTLDELREAMEIYENGPIKYTNEIADYLFHHKYGIIIYYNTATMNNNEIMEKFKITMDNKRINKKCYKINNKIHTHEITKINISKRNIFMNYLNIRDSPAYAFNWYIIPINSQIIYTINDPNFTTLPIIFDNCNRFVRQIKYDIKNNPIDCTLFDHKNTVNYKKILGIYCFDDAFIKNRLPLIKSNYTFYSYKYKNRKIYQNIIKFDENDTIDKIKLKKNAAIYTCENAKKCINRNSCYLFNGYCYSCFTKTYNNISRTDNIEITKTYLDYESYLLDIFCKCDDYSNKLYKINYKFEYNKLSSYNIYDIMMSIYNYCYDTYDVNDLFRYDILDTNELQIDVKYFPYINTKPKNENDNNYITVIFDELVITKKNSWGSGSSYNKLDNLYQIFITNDYNHQNIAVDNIIIINFKIILLYSLLDKVYEYCDN